MRFTTQVQGSRMAAMTAMMLIAAAEALAQEQRTGARRQGEEEERWRAHRIVISIPDRKLALIEDGKVVRIYRTAVGAAKTPSPTGTFTIIDRIPNPTWWRRGKVVGPGARNPLGTRWMGLSAKGFGIHGTSNPRSIGHAVSHGCIRMRDRDVEELFEMAPVGAVVELHGERDETVARIFAPVLIASASAGGQ